MDSQIIIQLCSQHFSSAISSFQKAIESFGKLSTGPGGSRQGGSNFSRLVGKLAFAMLGVAVAVRAKRAALRVEIGEAAHSGRTTVLLIERVLTEVVHSASRCRSRVSCACPGLAHAIGFLAGWAHPAMVDISAALASAGSLVQSSSICAFTFAGALWLTPRQVEQVEMPFPGPDIRPRGLFDTEVVVN